MNSSSRSLLRHYLLAGYVFLIGYASLSPFSGWQEQGLTFWAVLTSPLLQTYSWFDALSNLLAYFPLGVLLGLTLHRHHRRVFSVGVALVVGVLLSLLMEYLQMYLPNRISSNMDVLTNAVGTLVGAVVAVRVADSGWFKAITQWRISLFAQGGGAEFGLALIVLWMFAQVNPSLPMLGNVFITAPAHVPFVPRQAEPFDLWESLAVSLNLAMVGALLMLLLRSRRQAATVLMVLLSVTALVKFIAGALLLKSWALLLWLNGEAVFGIFIGALLLIMMGWFGRGVIFWIAAVLAFLYLVLAVWVLERVPAGEAMRLYQWHFGHLRNYNGLSQQVVLLFPVLMLFYLWWLGWPRDNGIINSSQEDA